MYEKVSERSEVLDDRIDEFAEIIREHYKIPELGDPAAATEVNFFSLYPSAMPQTYSRNR